MKSVLSKVVALALMGLMVTGMVACKQNAETTAPAPAEQAAPAADAAAPAAPAADAAAPAADAAAPAAPAADAAAPAAPAAK
ncbi:MAG: hypothetical protein AB1413_13275 [Thermodesulfobacteriota bacterium]